MHSPTATRDASHCHGSSGKAFSAGPGWSRRGDLPGLPATGRTVTMTGLTQFFTSGGRVTGHWQVGDRLGVWRQLQQG